MVFNFNFQPFEDDVVILGAKGHGKTTRAKWVMSKIDRLPYWCFDYQHLFTGFGNLTHDIASLKYGQYIFQPYNRGEETFMKFASKIISDVETGKLADTVIFWDELHQYTLSKQKIYTELDTIVQTYRNQGISNVFMSLRPAKIPNTLLSNASHVFAYGLNLMSDIVWLRDYIGEKAWLLLSPDKRRHLKEFPQISKHTCIYRNQLEDTSEILFCHCSDCEPVTALWNGVTI